MEETEDQLQETEDELQVRTDELAAANAEIQRLIASYEDKIKDLIASYEDRIKHIMNCYVARKNDTIDETLENWMRDNPEKEKMKILFLRESEGVYQFGQRKVYMKVEKGRNLKVRVGGGFMHIDEFIDQYTESEIQKVERNNVINRFHNKISMQKIAVEQSANDVELSPIRQPHRPISPDVRRVTKMTNLDPIEMRRSVNISPLKRGMTPVKGEFSPVKKAKNKKGNLKYL